MNRSRRGVLPAVAALAAFLGVLVVTGAATPAPTPAPAPAEAASEAGAEAAMEALLRKCPLSWNHFPDAPRWGVVVDGVLVDDGATALSRVMERAERGEPQWGRFVDSRLMCGEELYNRMGVIVRSSAVVIHTEKGPVAPALELLSELADRQQAHFEAHGRFAATLEELDESPSESALTPTEGLTITLEEGAAGWTAILEVEGYPSTCGVFGGTAEPLHYRAPEHTPRCPVSRIAAVGVEYDGESPAPTVGTLETGLRGCPSRQLEYPEGTPRHAIIVNGELAWSGDDLAESGLSNPVTDYVDGIVTVKVLCNDLVRTSFDILAWHGSFVIYTRETGVQGVRDDLRALHAAQAAHRASTGEWARSLEELGWEEGSPGVSLHLEDPPGRSEGWRAVATHPAYFESCAIGAGFGAPPLASWDPDTPYCHHLAQRVTLASSNTSGR